MRRAGETPAGAQEDAAYWFARLRSGEESIMDRYRFQRWLEREPANPAAYAECQALWEESRFAAADETILAMRRDALALSPEPSGRGWYRIGAAAATIVLLLVAGLTLLRPNETRTDSEEDGVAIAQARDSSLYRTQRGQRSVVTLADGSVVELNADSLLRVAYDANGRKVRLLRGQALFDVAHEPGRPFVVEAGAERITAIGTSFDVRIRPDEVRVTLIEGRVSVEREAGASRGEPARRLAPGEQLVARESLPFVVQAANVENAVSWRTGRVMFTDEPLSEVVDEINRYSTRQVVLADASLGDLRVSGVFRVGSVDSFTSALVMSFPVTSRLDEDRDEIILGWR